VGDAHGVPGTAVAEGVGRIPGFVNSYLYAEGNATVLIDTGFSQRAKPIVRAFKRANVPLGRVEKVLLTHHHLDHMGGAAFLVEATHAPLSCHAEDAPFVDGRTRQPMPLVMRWFARVHPAPVAVLLRDEDQVGALRVVFVPGHTPGEVAFYHPTRKILFSGDSVVEKRGRLTMAAPRFASNLAQAVRSLERLRALEIETLLPGHGEPVSKDVGGLLDDLIRRAPVEFLGRRSS
jgi:glyoxylase-like metal-dependent hydrolase (beta-lactamase superfamily II)